MTKPINRFIAVDTIHYALVMQQKNWLKSTVTMVSGKYNHMIWVKITEYDSYMKSILIIFEKIYLHDWNE